MSRENGRSCVMCEYKFKVASPWHEQLMLWIPFSVLTVLLISIGLCAGYPVQSIGTVAVYFPIFLVASLVGIMFRIQVDGETIRVRSWYGKRYELNCEDISKVVCTRRDSVKYGLQFYLTIEIQQREFTMHRGMVGFEAMAGYILAQLDAGKIKQTAVSKSCEEQLKKYHNGLFGERRK